MRIRERQDIVLPLCRGGGCWDSCTVDQGVLCSRRSGGGGRPGHGESAWADHKVRWRHHGRHVEANALCVGVRVDGGVGEQRCRVRGEGRGRQQYVGNGQRGHRARGKCHPARGERHTARRVTCREEEVQACRE